MPPPQKKKEIKEEMFLYLTVREILSNMAGQVAWNGFYIYVEN